jgi:hypothetical protein
LLLFSPCGINSADCYPLSRLPALFLHTIIPRLAPTGYIPATSGCFGCPPYSRGDFLPQYSIDDLNVPPVPLGVRNFLIDCLT